MTDHLYLRYGTNDLRKNKGVNIALAVVLILSAFLMATGSMVMERLVGSINQLFEQAKPPHFLQMHKGEYDEAALARFAAQHPEIDGWLVEEMLGFDSSALTWRREATGASGSLSASLIDNLFVTQNDGFDLLIDLDGGVPEPTAGQVYVPVAYQQEFALQPGDELTVRTADGARTMTVAGFVRDSQMASSLSSATRFLVSEADFSSLTRAGGGTPEIIVEYRLTDPGQATAFQTAYESDASLPRNGQAVTYDMIRMINAFSDGLVAIALVFVSLLLIAIALLNLRFVISGTLEDQVREIGVMKAIGLPDRAIRRLFLTKYSVMTLLACLVGGALAIGATRILTAGIQVNYAAAPVGVWTFAIPLLALAAVYGIVVAICSGVLAGVRRIEVVNALVHGSTLDERQTARRAARQAKLAQRTSLASGDPTRLNTRLALTDLRADARQWALIPLVFFLAAVLMTLPTNLLSTFSSPRFVTYMGAPESDLRADLQFSPAVDADRTALLAAMDADPRLDDVRAYANVLYETPGPEGWETLRVEVGDYTGGTVSYVSGAKPGPGEIALSYLNANQHHLKPGDTMQVRRDGVTADVRVSGVYQDVTSGGFTAKMQGDVTGGATGYVIYADAVEGADPAALASEYDAAFPEASVIPMREYVQQTLAYVTDAFFSAAVIAFGFGLGVAVLITCLFLKLRLTRERRSMGVLSAIGFSASEIIAQIRLKTLVAVAAGTLLGLLFAATAGEALVGGVLALAGMGIAQLHFIINPWLVLLAYPVLLIGAGYLGSVLLTAPLRAADKSSWLRA